MTRMLQIGDQFDRFQIQAHLAQGGMSDIYRAYDVVNRCEVALKIPDKMSIGDPAQFERFQRELEVLNTLDHPAILKGLGSGRYNRVPYLVTAYLEGGSLRDLISAEAPIDCARAVEITRKIAEGMGYCHAQGIIHRDLKPENIMISSQGQPVIMDFGLALTPKAHRVTYSNLTSSMGTPDYMAPEQIEGKRGDARTDVYALGTILFEMIAGQPPFTGDNALAVMAQRMNRAAPRLDRSQPCASAELAAVVARSLQPDPQKRYAGMPEFIEALDHPETADLSILEQSAEPGRLQRLLRSTGFKAAAISTLIIGAMIAAALLLQALR